MHLLTNIETCLIVPSKPFCKDNAEKLLMSHSPVKALLTKQSIWPKSLMTSSTNFSILDSRFISNLYPLCFVEFLSLKFFANSNAFSAS